ncbi:hypothetical protein DITRI_Ditri19aG0060200 [Diplodiscus trichospermus]
MMVEECIQGHHLMPWKIGEIDASHSLQLIMRDSIQDMEDNGSKVSVYAQQNDTEMLEMNELSSIRNG